MQSWSFHADLVETAIAWPCPLHGTSIHKNGINSGHNNLLWTTPRGRNSHSITTLSFCMGHPSTKMAFSSGHTHLLWTTMPKGRKLKISMARSKHNWSLYLRESRYWNGPPLVETCVPSSPAKLLDLAMFAPSCERPTNQPQQQQNPSQMGGVGLMDVKSAQKNLGNQHFQMGQPQKKRKKKESTHRASKTPPGQAWGGGGEKLSFGKKLEPRHLLQPSLDPPKTKHGLKTYIGILKEALVVGWVGCMHECTLFFFASSKLFSSTKSSKPITPNPELCTWEEEKTYNAKHVGEHSRSSSGPKPPAAQHPQKPRLLGTVPRATAVLCSFLRHLFLLLLLLLLLLPSIKPSIPSKKKQIPCCSSSSSLSPCLLQPYTQREQASKQPPPTTLTTLLTPQQPPLTWVSPKFHTKLLKSHNKIPHTPEKASALYTGLLQLNEDLNCKKTETRKNWRENKRVEDICIYNNNNNNNSTTNDPQEGGGGYGEMEKV